MFLRFITITLPLIILQFGDDVLIEALWLGDCNVPLGISTGSIPDKDLTASSSHDVIVGPHNGRLGRDGGGGAWCPRGMVDRHQNEFIEVSLGLVPKVVTGVGTQGRFANNFGVEFTPAFTLQYKRNSNSPFVTYSLPSNSNETVVFVGNADTFTEIRNELDLPIMATHVRIRPISAHPRVVCLRFELYGCDNKERFAFYQLGGRPSPYFLGEGALYDGAITTSSSLEEGIPTLLNAVVEEEDQKKSTKTFAKKKKKKRSMNVDYDNSAIHHIVSNVSDDSNKTFSTRTDQKVASDQVFDDDTLVLPVIPPGEIIAPELPQNISIVFDEIRNFSKIFLYLDPIHPLIAGAHPQLMISTSFGLDILTWMDPELSDNFSLDSEAKNISIETRGRSAQIIQLFINIDHAEVNIQELYFVSETCDCNLNKKSQSDQYNNLGLQHLPSSKEKHLKNCSNELKTEKSIDDSPFDSDNYKTTLRPENSLTTKPILKTPDAAKQNQSSSSKNIRTTSVWVLNTASTHRTYVGVAVGFSVGVGLLLCVWVYMWLKSSRGKTSSPRMFRRSPDTLDMACLMDGTVSDYGIVTPTNDEAIVVPSTPGGRLLSRSSTGGLLSSKLQEDISSVPLVSGLSSGQTLDFRSPTFHSPYFGLSLKRGSETDVFKKKNTSEKNPNFVLNQNKTNYSTNHVQMPSTSRECFPKSRSEISFISSTSINDSWDTDTNFFSYHT